MISKLFPIRAGWPLLRCSGGRSLNINSLTPQRSTCCACRFFIPRIVRWRRLRYSPPPARWKMPIRRGGGACLSRVGSRDIRKPVRHRSAATVGKHDQAVVQARRGLMTERTDKNSESCRPRAHGRVAKSLVRAAGRSPVARAQPGQIPTTNAFSTGYDSGNCSRWPRSFAASASRTAT